MSRDIDYTPGLRTGGVLFFRLVAACGVDGELREDLAGAVLDGGDVGVPGEQDDAFVLMGAADAEVPEASGVAKGDLAVGVDTVGADPPVFPLGGDGWGGLGGRCVGLGGRAAFEGAVRPFVVVDVAELGQELVQVRDRVGLRLVLEPFLRVWWKRSILPWVWGWLGRPFFWVMPKDAIRVSKALRPPRPPARRVV